MSELQKRRVAYLRGMPLYNPYSINSVYLLCFPIEMHGLFTLGGEEKLTYTSICSPLRLSKLFHCLQCFQETLFPENYGSPVNTCIDSEVKYIIVAVCQFKPTGVLLCKELNSEDYRSK